jgi:hypothetical protein
MSRAGYIACANSAGSESPAGKRTMTEAAHTEQDLPTAAKGYLELPEGWKRVRSQGPGPFVTSEVLRAPDGSEVHWRSRSHRKRRRASAGAREPTWWRPRTRGWWMSVLFSVGAFCFLVAAVAAQWESSPRGAIGVTFFVGSIFFTSAAYLQYSETVNADHTLTADAKRARWRPASWEPRRIDWVASSVQLVGTVFFNMSTFAAMKHGLTTKQTNTRVWGPDALGSVCFLIASELAYAEVCHRWVCFRNRSLSWWIVALNMTGSIAFGAAAVASLLEPGSGEPISARISNGGTAIGGLCFLIGAVLLMPEAARESAQPGD